MKHLVCFLFLSCSACSALANTIIWDFGPSSGVYRSSYSNLSGQMYFADRVVFTSAVTVDGYVHFTSAPVSGKSFEFRVLADDGGKPGAAIADFHQTYSGNPPLAGSFGPFSICRVAFTWAAPVRLGPGAYWFGASGDGFSAMQYTVDKPGDGQTARFYSSGPAAMVAGDQLFQLTGGPGASSPEPGAAPLVVGGALFVAARCLRHRRKRTLKIRPIAARQIL